MLKTRNEVIRDLADRAQDQCKTLADSWAAVIDGSSAYGDAEPERFCYTCRDAEGRACLILVRPFSEPDDADRITVIRVDAILSLAKLLNGEHQVPFDA